LGPILVLSFCPYFLKQKVSRKQWIALIIILICIIISELNFKL